MKKITISVLLCAVMLGTVRLSGQEKVELQKYDYVTNGDTNLYQGIPNIGFPLFNVEVPTTGISINLSVNYSTESLSGYSLISDVGKGWNFSTVGSVVRSKTLRVEDYTTSVNNTTADSDVYYYNYPGGSGKFYIGMDSVSHELMGVHTSPSNDKIIVTKDPAKAGKVTSFTIIDTKGNRYLFDKNNINTYESGFINNRTKQLINSGFFLSKILNNKNEEVANIEYETTTELVNQFVGSVQQQKIKKINVNGIGSIEYIYRYNNQPHLLVSQWIRDWYVIEKVVLKDTRNQIINQYFFDNLDNGYFRELINLDKNGNQIQKFAFEYNNEFSTGGRMDAFGYPNAFNGCDMDSGILPSVQGTNPATSFYGSLERIILPTGGKIEYEFESNSYFKEETCGYNEFCYYDYYDFDKIYTLNFDTKYGGYPTTYTIPDMYNAGQIFVKYQYMWYASPPAKPGVSNDVNLYINNEEGQPYYDLAYDIPSPCPEITVFKPGSTLNFGFGGYRQAHGTVEIYAAKKARRDQNTYGYGLRIKSIKNFNPGSATPVTYTQYEYNKFDNFLMTSGEILDVSADLDFNSGREENKPIGYNNIKVTNMIDGSYSKYYYTPTFEINLGFNPSFSGSAKDMANYIKAMGVLQKKEDFSATGQPLQKTEAGYQFREVLLPNVANGNNPVKKINISRQTSVTETYISGTSKKLVSSSETNMEDKYGNVSSTRETLADGTVLEKTFLYPEDKGVQKLLSANMVNIPLETSTKKNGKPVGKAETKFDDPNHLYPTSVISYNMQTQAPVTASTLDVYDSKGNLVQTTGKNGIPVTTIWGYYQTKPIAVIAGASYAQVASLATVTAAIAASNADRDDPSQEPQLLTALENLRKDPVLQSYTVTCTTYDPMIGITNSISANGIRTINVYDAANRLLKVTDAAGKTIQEYQYHYKN
ncbi:hypothetical protein [uncultured Chryseobacterium sp.]|uniref:hypothetical protein n=1 Tax=uncultured Chryseobacterium sp. TaxID=259322 RepID=UPI0025E4CAEE|nr:hypothetical protein [uncultured Chryseobacterium sp.]